MIIFDNKSIASEFLIDDPQLKNVFDGIPLTYFDVTGINDCWVGFDLGRSMEIAKAAYCPRTDDNDVAPGDEYELFYWDDEWVSLGRRMAKGYSLTWDEVPVNVLLWFHDHTNGIEERPFTYENGKQIWW